jgi:hypothetical protein
MQKLPMNLIDKIDCVGDFSGSGITTNRICAASGTSYYQKDSWTIFLTSSAIKVLNFLIIYFILFDFRNYFG